MTFVRIIEEAWACHHSSYVEKLAEAEVRVNETFCFDRDYQHVQTGRVVYPDQINLENSVAAIGGTVLILDADRSIVEVN